MAAAADRTRPSPTPESAGGTRRRRLAVALLLGLATVLVVPSLFGIWAKRVLLDTDGWVATSAPLLENDEIREALGPYLADRIVASLDLTRRFEKALPRRLDPFAAPLAGAITRMAADNAADRLSRPRARNAWREANRVAHRQFVALVRDESRFVRATRGVVSLDVGAIAQAVAQLTRAEARIAIPIPEGTGRLTIIESRELGAVQSAVRVLDAVGTWLWAISLGAFVAAGFLARGFRRRALAWAGYGLVVVAVVLLVALRLGGDWVVAALVENPVVEPAARGAWDVAVASLRDAARTVLGIALIVLTATWVAGAGRHAATLRRLVAPSARDRPGLVWGGFGVVVLAGLLWAPTRATSDAVSVLVLIACAALGLEALRRLIVAEHAERSSRDG